MFRVLWESDSETRFSSSKLPGVNEEDDEDEQSGLVYAPPTGGNEGKQKAVEESIQNEIMIGVKDQHRYMVMNLLSKYSEIATSMVPGSVQLVEHTIDLTDRRPLRITLSNFR